MCLINLSSTLVDSFLRRSPELFFLLSRNVVFDFLPVTRHPANGTSQLIQILKYSQQPNRVSRIAVIGTSKRFPLVAITRLSFIGKEMFS